MPRTEEGEAAAPRTAKMGQVGETSCFLTSACILPELSLKSSRSIAGTTLLIVWDSRAARRGCPSSDGEGTLFKSNGAADELMLVLCSAPDAPNMHTVTFFITTARSGTQWFHQTLANVYSDLLVLEHEPIRYSYSPRRCLRNPPALAALRTDPIVRRHLDRIHKISKERDYIEVGFPAFAAAPLLWEEFQERLRFVHLVRHPVRVAASVVTHRWFDPDPLDRADLKEHVVLTPTDPGVCLGHYAGRWANMTAFEKALFYWTEVHLYGREVQDAFFAVPFFRVNFEDVLAREETRQQFARFLGVPYRSDWDTFLSRRIDRYHNRIHTTIDLRSIYSMPEVTHLAATMGYDVDSIENSEVQQRYRLSLASRLRRGIKSQSHNVVAFGTAVMDAANGTDFLTHLLAV